MRQAEALNKSYAELTHEMVMQKLLEREEGRV